MKIDDNFKNRVQAARQAANLTQGDLADKVGVVRRQIAAYEAGDSKPRIKVLNNLAVALGATTEWLSSGIGEGPSIDNIKRTITVPEIPVLSYSDSIFSLGSPAAFSKFIPAPPNTNSQIFAYEIMGNSMTSAGSVSLPSGTIVIIDPTRTPKDMDFVLAYMDGMGVFKQLIFDQGNWYLTSLNPDFSPYIVEDLSIIVGVAIQAQIDLSCEWIKAFRTFDGVSLGSSIKTESPKSPKDISPRLDKIESMLEQLLKNK
ncbi:LexA family protein [Morganella psychrotolerans]|uniref:HTH cro/C1-type domain-containing protein n=1 Tax=Morganella psychrotolerans TaxID=368603 RepID=A0A1B8HQZ3_9GAMM|nr:LexA family transcriptional regulator [Morganella psychrotolerans]OBU11690.1 hypothetical protein AYY17_03020 [Morganella psychrotolerans]